MKKLLLITFTATLVGACTTAEKVSEPAKQAPAPVAAKKATPAKPVEIKDDFYSTERGDPNVPTSAQWEEKNKDALAKATKREVLAKFLESEKAAMDLLAQVKPHYGTDSLVARQIAAVTQLVMNPKCEKAPACRKLWTDALMKSLLSCSDSYCAIFFIDQLRWCGYPEQAMKLEEIAAEANRVSINAKGVADIAIQTANELDSYSLCPEDEGFVPLFNGKDLTGWVANPCYGVPEPGVLACIPGTAPKGGGNLSTEKQYSDFILRFEVNIPTNANNGLGIRLPKPDSHAAYEGMELQIIDDGGDKYGKLAPYQYHGSIYGIVPAKRDSDGKVMTKTAGRGSYLKPAGQWNFQEVHVIGSMVKDYVNGILIVDADISKFKGDGDTMDKRKHPGLHNKKGHIAWLGHGDNVKWRNIRIKEFKNADEYKAYVNKQPKAPRGFTTLFTGKDFQNWKGVTTKERFDQPAVRKAAKKEKRAEMQKFADELMKKHWHIRNGVLFFDGFKGGYSLATAKDYRNFEMYVDWRLQGIRGDSGLYLRGCPQVQIWDAHNQWHIGSGGLYNNKKNPSQALVIADKTIGDWNRFYIRMIDDRVTVYLNGQLVVDNTILENYFDRKNPIYPCDQIELQCHGDPLEFKNIYIRELP